MTIQRAYSPGWGVGEKLTSAQQNAIDLNTTYALDKRAGVGDLLASIVQATGSGRIIASVQTGPDANTTFHISGGNSIIRVPTLTAGRTYTLGHSGATGGDHLRIYVEGTACTASGYANIANNLGTGIFRLGMVNHSSASPFAEGSSAEFLFNGTGWQLMRGAGPGLRPIEFLTNAVWVCPPGVYHVPAYGYGGGGGGAPGGRGGNSLGGGGIGGGGGGGSVAALVLVPVVPYRSYQISIGAGGSGGHYDQINVAGNNCGETPSDGGDTTITDLSTNQVIASWRGGGAGYIGTRTTATQLQAYARGGSNMRPHISVASTATARHAICLGNVASGGGFAFWGEQLRPGWGGNGCSANIPTGLRFSFGMNSAEGYTGGAPGRFGTGPTGLFVDPLNPANGWNAGGGGGGGGAGPGGPGVTGGVGGSFTNNNGDNGSSPTSNGAANSGAGGGGGGGGAAGGAGNGGEGSAGSRGGSGKLTFWVIK
jgi:hypothetical protein